LALSAGSDREWDPPTLNEQVLLLSPSGQFANGVVITGLPSDHIPANNDRAVLVSRGGIDIVGPINHQGRAT
jgi:phage baseplate assembly protein V